CLRFVQTLKFCDADTLRWITEHSNDFFADNQIAAGSLNCLLDLCIPCVDRSAVEHFAFRDEIHFRLALSVKALDCCGTNSGTRNHRQYDCVPSFHDVLPLTTRRTPASGAFQIMRRLRETRK